MSLNRRGQLVELLIVLSEDLQYSITHHTITSEGAQAFGRTSSFEVKLYVLPSHLQQQFHSTRLLLHT